jgi:hypothetical protein
MAIIAMRRALRLCLSPPSRAMIRSKLPASWLINVFAAAFFGEMGFAAAAVYTR